MKNYQTPKSEIITFEVLDVLCYSQEESGTGDKIAFGGGLGRNLLSLDI